MLSSTVVGIVKVTFAYFWRALKWVTAKGVVVLDNVGKISAGILVLFFLIRSIWDGPANFVRVQTAKQFGVVGAVKYELGNAVQVDANGVYERKPTKNGGLYLLEDERGEGEREYEDLVYGDVMQAKTNKYIRLNMGCAEPENRNCGSSPRLFALQPGECLVFIRRLYSNEEQPLVNEPVSGAVSKADVVTRGESFSSTEDLYWNSYADRLEINDLIADLERFKSISESDFRKVEGGWIEAGTTACGIFN